MTWFAGRWRNHQPKRAEKPHSKSAQRKLPDGPATRPITPLAVENGVGKPAAPEKGAPNAGLGKREWRTPTPHLSLLDRKVRQGLMFLFQFAFKMKPIRWSFGFLASLLARCRSLADMERELSQLAARLQDNGIRKGLWVLAFSRAADWDNPRSAPAAIQLCGGNSQDAHIAGRI